MTGAVLAALGIGVTLFVAASALSLWRLGGPILGRRLVALPAILAGLAIVGTQAMPPVVPLGLVAVVLLAIVVLEELRPPDAG